MTPAMERLLIVLQLIVATSRASEYCSAKLCRSGKHIACGHSGAFHPTSCQPDAEMIHITPELKVFILREFNKRRNQIAGGDDRRFKAACRMATIQWDDELAALAALSVKQCQIEHDICRNTFAFQHSGQNLAQLGYMGGTFESEEMLRKSIDLWYSESAVANMYHIREYPRHYSHNGLSIGHFAIMVTDRNTRVGCAASTFSKRGRDYKYFLMACNFATTNILGCRVYEACERSAVKCSTGTNPMYSNLCSISEPYDVNSDFKF